MLASAIAMNKNTEDQDEHAEDEKGEASRLVTAPPRLPKIPDAVANPPNAETHRKCRYSWREVREWMTLIVAIITLAAVIWYAVIARGQWRQMIRANKLTKEVISDTRTSFEQSSRDTQKALAISAGHAVAAKQSADAATDALTELKKSTDVSERQLIAAHKAYVFGYCVFGEVLEGPGGQLVRLRLWQIE